MAFLNNYSSDLRLDFTIPDNKHQRFHDLNGIMGYLTDDEAHALYILAKDGPGDGAVVEIGSFAGRSAAYIADGLKDGDRGQTVTCIDPFDVTLTSPIFQYRSEFKVEESLFQNSQNTLFDLFQYNLQRVGLSDFTVPIPNLSVNVSKTWQAPIRLLFIDGLHNYINVCADVEAWTPYLEDGAILCMHDMTYWAMNTDDTSMMHVDGVTRYVETRLLDHPNYEFVRKADSLIILRYRKEPERKNRPDRMSDPITFSMPFFPPIYWRSSPRLSSSAQGLAELNGWYADDATDIHAQKDGVVLTNHEEADAEIASFYRPIDTVIGETYEVMTYVHADHPDHITYMDVYGIQGWKFAPNESPTIGMQDNTLVKRTIVQGSGYLRLKFRAYCRRSWIKISSGATSPGNSATLMDFSLAMIS